MPSGLVANPRKENQSMNVLGSYDEIGEVGGDRPPKEDRAFNYQIADGDALGTEEAVAEAPTDSGLSAGNTNRDEASWQGESPAGSLLCPSGKCPRSGKEFATDSTLR
jgi:hypothetical protein